MREQRSDRVEFIRVLSQIGVIELLEQDSRPIFMIDLADTHNTPEALHIIFANSALRACPALFDSIQLRPESPYVSRHTEKVEKFYRWLLSYGADGNASETQEHPFGNAVWTCSTLRGRLRIISATQTAHSLSRTPLTLPQHISRASTSAPQSRHSHRTPASAQVHAHEGSDYFGPGTIASPIQADSPSSGSKRVLQKQEDQQDVLGGFTPGQDHENGESPFFDWTRLPISVHLPQHIQFARSIDWANTPLGPMSTWSYDLRQMCNLIMASPHPAAMYWGPDLVAIYNEAYVTLAGQKHPQLMGQRYADAWAEIWDQVEPTFQEAVQTGQSTMKDDDRLFMMRFRYLEETFFSWSIIPIVGSDGAVVGLYNPAFENTARKIAERRMITLREVGERAALARDVKDFWREVKYSLETNQWDSPFVLLYSVSDETDSDASSVMSGSLMGAKQCFLEGSLGVPDGHQCAPKEFELRSGDEGFGPLFREAMRADGPLLVRVTGGPLSDGESGYESTKSDDMEDILSTQMSTTEIPYEMLEGIEWRGFGDACRSVVVCKIHPTTTDNVLGFAVFGVNPRRPYDEDYNLYMLLLTRQIATSLASVVLFEDEIRRGQRAAQLAALDRIQLSAQLAARTQEARDLEIRFTHMAELSPAGLFIADSNGRISFCNNSWYEISGIPRDPTSVDQWIEFVVESDQERVRGIWSKLLQDHESVTAEFCFQKKWIDHLGHQFNTWVLFSAHPEVVESADGTASEVRGLFCNLTDISAQKRAQEFEKQKMEEALEMKRQQENFIDITSHEMRNPLSAILQCADDITATLSDVLEKNEDKHTLSKSQTEQLENSIYAAETVILCAQHQKRIVDDVLTLSKLDSHMLVVCPVDVQPLNIMSRVLKMFEGETTSAGISLSMIVDESFARLSVDWVELDPQRVSQGLINLMSNAIKFTSNQSRLNAATDQAVASESSAPASSQPNTSIIVSIAAYEREPSTLENPIVTYFPHRRSRDNANHKQALGSSLAGTSITLSPGVNQLPNFFDNAANNGESGDYIYLQFAVTDTGPGLKDSEKKLLFNRFSQASPRTHVTYGGSGLGLFISRELAELQGGQIGVSSEYGNGCTFAFYVRCKKGQEPKEEKDKEAAIPSNLKNIAGTSEGKWVKGRRSGLGPGTSAAGSGANSDTEKAEEAKRRGLSVLVVEVSL
jgi:PAS domain S-box-containing protein